MLFLQAACEQKKTQSLKWDEGLMSFLGPFTVGT